MMSSVGTGALRSKLPERSAPVYTLLLFLLAQSRQKADLGSSGSSFSVTVGKMGREKPAAPLWSEGSNQVGQVMEWCSSLSPSLLAALGLISLLHPSLLHMTGRAVSVHACEQAASQPTVKVVGEGE